MNIIIFHSFFLPACDCHLPSLYIKSNKYCFRWATTFMHGRRAVSQLPLQCKNHAELASITPTNLSFLHSNVPPHPTMNVYSNFLRHDSLPINYINGFLGTSVFNRKTTYNLESCNLVFPQAQNEEQQSPSFCLGSVYSSASPPS